jgi:hypothetical protein
MGGRKGGKKNPPPNLQNVLGEPAKITNFTKSRTMNSRLFTVICEEMGSQFKTVAS